MDMDCDVDDTYSDIDSEEDIEQLKKLNAVLDEEDEEPNESMSQLTSYRSSSTIASKSSSLINALDTAIANNKLLDEKQHQLEKVLCVRLRECRQKLQAIQGTLSQQEERSEIFRYISCGRPYFKDRMNFPAPDNEDAKMAKSQMYDFSLVISVPGWTVRDKSQLITMIHKMSINIRKNELYSRIKALKRKNKLKPSKKLQNEIAALKKEVDLVAEKPLSQIALPINEEYDWDIVANRLNRRHTAQEYQSLWKLFFHPSINKNSWLKEEHKALQKIASENNQQDWDDIAKKLGTGRTGYQCFVYYRTNMTNSFTGKKWTNEEITYLKRLIDYFKEDSYIPWGKIAAAMENRTKIQIYNKYLRLIEQRKGRFLPEEDSVILNCVARFGTNFRRMTSYLPGRSMVQIRARHQVLSKMRISTVWTVEDDKKLLQIMSNQDSSMNFSTATQYFPGRNRIKIRSRYVTLLKWMKKYPNLDIEHAPRRGARRLNHGKASENLTEAVENLKNILNTEVATKSKKKKICLDSSTTEIEDAIIATIVNELVKQFETKKSPVENEQIVLGHDHVVSKEHFNMTNLRKCLLFLNANLNKAAYDTSKYSEEYPDLGSNEKDVSLVKVKSYSRKNTVRTIKIDDSPNIWGDPPLTLRNYVFPPHYATITGCRALLAHVCAAAPYCESVNLHVLVRRNPILKEQLDQVLERFYLLFTWPMLLSNEGPNEFNDKKIKRIDSVFVRPPTLPNPPEVTIKLRCIKKFKNVDVAEIIDLGDDDDKKDEVTVVEKLESRNDKLEDEELFLFK